MKQSDKDNPTRQEKRAKRKANQRKMAVHGQGMKTLKKKK